MEKAGGGMEYLTAPPWQRSILTLDPNPQASLGKWRKAPSTIDRKDRPTQKFLQEAIQHPEGLLVELRALDRQVLCLQVVRFRGSCFHCLALGGCFFMALDEVGHEVLRGQTSGRHRGKIGNFREPLEPSFGV